MAEAIERGAGATRVQRHFLGSDLRIGPANSRFEENGATMRNPIWGLGGRGGNKDRRMSKATESKRPRQLKRQKDKKEGMQHEDFPGATFEPCRMPYLTIIEPQKTPIFSAARRSRVFSSPFLSVPELIGGELPGWRRTDGGSDRKRRRSDALAGATRVQRHLLGSDLRIGPANSRFEENGATSKTHGDAMTYGLFRASDIVYLREIQGSWGNKDRQMSKATESKRPRQLKRQKRQKEGMQHEDFPGRSPILPCRMPYLTIIEPQKTPIFSAARRSRCVFVSVPFRCPVNRRRAGRGGVRQMAEAIERGAGATRELERRACNGTCWAPTSELGPRTVDLKRTAPRVKLMAMP
ncbi:unnamed protein product [Prunus brigantina]